MASAPGVAAAQAGGAHVISQAGADCPDCRTTSHWSAEIVLSPLTPAGVAQTFVYFSCPRCGRIWVPGAQPATAPLWPPLDDREGDP